jgi:hypothetical protein
VSARLPECLPVFAHPAAAPRSIADNASVRIVHAIAGVRGAQCASPSVALAHGGAPPLRAGSAAKAAGRGGMHA